MLENFTNRFLEAAIAGVARYPLLPTLQPAVKSIQAEVGQATKDAYRTQSSPAEYFKRPPRGVHTYFDEWFKPDNPEFRKFMMDMDRRVTHGRELVADLELTDHESFMRYFEQFTPEALQLIFRNLCMLIVTEGCNAGCVKTCAIGAERGLKGHIPFKTVEWIFDNFRSTLSVRDSVNNFVMYGASDPKYYKDAETGKDGVDLIMLYRDRFGCLPFTSVSVGKDPTTLNFMLRCIQEDINISRISFLYPVDKITPDELVEALKVKGGGILSEKGEKMIRDACSRYGRDAIGNFAKQGNGFKKPGFFRPDYEAPVMCSNGIVLRLGGTKGKSKFPPGFSAVVLTPVTTVTRYGYIEYPLDPRDVVVPRKIHMEQGLGVKLPRRVRLPYIKKPEMVTTEMDLQAPVEDNRYPDISAFWEDFRNHFDRARPVTLTEFRRLMEHRSVLMRRHAGDFQALEALVCVNMSILAQNVTIARWAKRDKFFGTGVGNNADLKRIILEIKACQKESVAILEDMSKKRPDLGSREPFDAMYNAYELATFELDHQIDGLGYPTPMFR